MIVPIYWTEKSKIRNLPELLAKYREQGGKIVEYQEVISLVVFSQRRPRFVWLPPGKSQAAGGIPSAIGCFFLGWWSIAGFFWTPAAIINNLMGGIDLTQVLTGPPPLPGLVYKSSAWYQLQVARRRQQIVSWGYAAAVLAAAVYWIVLPVVRNIR
jgi:hypothetical protein